MNKGSLHQDLEELYPDKFGGENDTHRFKQ